MIRFRKEWSIPAGVGVGSFIAGAVCGYFVGKRRFTEVVVHEEEPEDMQLQFDFHVEEVNKSYDRRVNELRVIVEDIRETLGQRTESRSDQVAREMHAYVDPPDAIIVEDEWDYEVEMRLRTGDKPYTIHQEEYMAEESDFNQVCLTYYAGDDVLCDEQNVPIYNPESIVGQLKFGHGSGDGSLVYVRNPKLEIEYEIQLEPGKYAVEILGAKAEEDILNDEIKHGNAIHKYKKD
jgi:hypothetical protein